MQLTPDQLVTKTREYIGETDAGVSSFTNPRILALLNEGLDDLVVRLDEELVYSATATTVQGQFNYDLPSNLIAIKEVYITDSNGKERPLTTLPSQEFLVERLGAGWRTDPNGQPRYAYKAGRNVMGIAPAPDSTWASRTVRIFYVRLHDAMTSGGSAPSIHEYFHPALADYAAWRIWRIKGDHKQADKYLEDYETKFEKGKMLVQRMMHDMHWTWADSDITDARLLGNLD